jgi:hypothetical protein
MAPAKVKNEKSITIKALSADLLMAIGLVRTAVNVLIYHLNGVFYRILYDKGEDVKKRLSE